MNRTATYDINGQNQVTAVKTPSATNLLYDTRGNLQNDGAVAFTYNADNLLLEAGTFSLRYDASNRLRLINSSTTAARQFLYDGQNLIAEYDGSGNLLRRYVHGPGLDNPLVWLEGQDASNVRFFTSDQQGSITAVTDSTGTAKMVYAYDEYGVPSKKLITAGYDSAFQYTGQVYLSDIGLYYYKARMYAPQLGRFLQTDPIGYGDGMNMYAYVGNDPVNNIDPFGLEQCVNGTACANSKPNFWDKINDFMNSGGNCGYGGTSCAPAPPSTFGPWNYSYTSPEPITPHRYDTDNVVCENGINIDPKEMADAMKRFAYPGQNSDQPLVSQAEEHVVWTNGFPGGYVNVYFSDKHLSTMNITQPAHVFYNGTIVRTAYIKDGAWRVHTLGSGKNWGFLALVNEIGGTMIFNKIDKQMKQFLKGTCKK